MNKLFTLIVIALLIVIAYAFYTAVDTFAAGDNTVSICDTVDRNAVSAYDGHSVDTLDANSRHCAANGKQVITTKKSHISTSVAQDVSAGITHDNHTKPVSSHPVVKQDHCNNGNGNGAEGCNASSKGNQDETSEKRDKDVNHPTH